MKKIKENLIFFSHILAIILTALIILLVLIGIFVILLPLFLIGVVIIGYKKLMIKLKQIKKHL